MKKLSPWTIILGVVALLVLVYFLTGFREGFSAPSITCPSNTKTGYQFSIADLQNLGIAISNNILSDIPFINEYMSWLATNFPTESNPGFVAWLLMTYSMNSGVAVTGTPPMVTNTGIPFPTDGTSEFLKNYATALTKWDPNPTINGPNPGATADLLWNDASTLNAYRSNIVWAYFYGACAAPVQGGLSPIKKPSAPSMSGGAASAPAPAPTSSPSTSTSAPPAASSSPNQPLTFYVPQPCKQEYKSVPGGSVELRCFD